MFVLRSVHLVELFAAQMIVESVYLLLEDVVQSLEDGVHGRQTGLLHDAHVSRLEVAALDGCALAGKEEIIRNLIILLHFHPLY